MEAALSMAGIAGSTLVALVLFRAVLHKTTAYLETVGFARDYGLIPEDWTAHAVRLLAVAEALAILMLVLPVTRAFGGILAAGLFAGYGLAMLAVLRAGRGQIECGCGGPPQVVSKVTIARNAVLTLVSLALWFLPVAPTGAFAAVAAVLVGVTLWLCLTVAETLDGNRNAMTRAADSAKSELFQ